MIALDRSIPCCEPSASARAANDLGGGSKLARQFDLVRMEAGVRELLLGLGEDPHRDGLKDTPRRVAKAMAELCGGLLEDPGRHLARVFEQAHDQFVLVRDIDVFSLCEHHLLPFVGKAHVAYLPGGGQVVGLSKLARMVEGYARRPQVQERLTDQIADALVRRLHARGAAVVIEAEHMCMRMRGVKSSHSRMVTTAARGLLRDDPAMRLEVMQLIANTKPDR